MAGNRFGGWPGGAPVNVVPLAADSLGVRSMATYVECGTTRVLIDPGATLAPNRFNLPPTDEEWEALRRANDRISAHAGRASLIFVSHYHEDHFRYDPALYAGRSLWAKDAARHIEGRQARRAATLWQALAQCPPVAAEGRRVETADAVLQASPPLSHGPDGTPLGYVVALTIEDRRASTRFVHASDVQGPLSAVAAAYLARQRPTLLYLSGPPAYLESQLGAELIDRGIDHLRRIVDQTGCRVILDHYALRDAGYHDRFRRLWDTGRVVTAAGYLGLPDAPLEARRFEGWAGRRKPPLPVRPSQARGMGEVSRGGSTARMRTSARPGVRRATVGEAQPWPGEVSRRRAERIRRSSRANRKEG
jgi:predicted metallo-beta-lactamase superfamily hydrolase